MPDLKGLCNLFEIAEKVKETKRYKSSPKIAVKESVSDHSWKTALMIWSLTSEFNTGIDSGKSIKMAIIHDMVEAVTDDIDHHEVAAGNISIEKKRSDENKAMNSIMKLVPVAFGQEIETLWREFEEKKTKEARLVRAIEHIETVDHLIHLGSSAYDDPDLIIEYAKMALTEAPELKLFIDQEIIRLQKEIGEGNR
ncbi:MAG TPA: HD domain-containing protein [bacterium]|nr:HD domain-containing protein [bacterium]